MDERPVGQAHAVEHESQKESEQAGVAAGRADWQGGGLGQAVCTNPTERSAKERTYGEDPEKTPEFEATALGKAASRISATATPSAGRSGSRRRGRDSL